MMTYNRLMKITTPALLTLFSLPLAVSRSAAEESSAASAAPAKELFLPARISRVPENNDFDDKESEFSFHRMVQGDNVALFWSKEYGDDPTANPEENKRFDPHACLRECERFYEYYVNELKMVQKGASLTDRHKLLVIVFGGDSGTAFGGGIDDKIGAVWTPAVRINRQPYGVLAHEMAHSFQFFSRIDSGHGPRGAISEMSAQYMLWQVYPEWTTFENYHLVDLMKKTHYAFLHPINMYHDPYVLEYWSNKHGKEFFGELSRQTRPGEDPVMTYKRLTEVTQEQFNDEMFDASRRFITWDMERIDEVASPYANQHFTGLNEVDDGWYRIDPAHCPQNYGYNGIKLEVPEAGTSVALTFKGQAGAEGYSAIQTDKAGWRYGFLASLENGDRVYGDVGSDPEGALTFVVPEQCAHLWLVVMGAPSEHWPVAGRRRGDAPGDPDEQWPYQIKLNGTSPDDSCIKAP